MSLPHVLQTAGEHMRDAQAAWALVQTVGLTGDEVELRRYVYETEAALKQASSLLDEFFYFHGHHVVDIDGGPF